MATICTAPTSSSNPQPIDVMSTIYSGKYWCLSHDNTLPFQIFVCLERAKSQTSKLKQSVRLVCPQANIKMSPASLWHSSSANSNARHHPWMLCSTYHKLARPSTSCVCDHKDDNRWLLLDYQLSYHTGLLQETESHLRQTYTVLPMFWTEGTYALERTLFQAALVSIMELYVKCAYRPWEKWRSIIAFWRYSRSNEK